MGPPRGLAWEGPSRCVGLQVRARGRGWPGWRDPHLGGHDECEEGRPFLHRQQPAGGDETQLRWVLSMVARKGLCDGHNSGRRREGKQARGPGGCPACEVHVRCSTVHCALGGYRPNHGRMPALLEEIKEGTVPWGIRFDKSVEIQPFVALRIEIYFKGRDRECLFNSFSLQQVFSHWLWSKAVIVFLILSDFDFVNSV